MLVFTDIVPASLYLSFYGKRKKDSLRSSYYKHSMALVALLL